jgi:PAS domain S-box-containing protein
MPHTGTPPSPVDAQSTQGKTRFTIGYVTPGIHDPVGNRLWQGVVDAAQHYDLNLICVAGGRLHDEANFLGQGNILYELLGAEHVDGIILWALSLYELSEPAEVAGFHRRYDPLPLVTIAHPIDDHPLVGVDNAPGIRELMEHLVSDHHYRRIAFMRGPATHPYAEERYRIYCEVLAAHQIPFDPLLVSHPGKWTDVTASQAMHLLFDERHLRPGVDVEALVTVNENFALIAIQALRARGVSIPHDVAVVGIHSAPQGRYATPPLTTVRIPTYERGYTAVEVLRKRLQGQAVPARIDLPATMIIRQSCGCLDPLVTRAKLKPALPLGGPAAVELPQNRRAASGDALTALGLERALAEQAHAAFSADVRGESAGTFLAVLENGLRWTLDAERLMAVWQDAISVLRQEARTWATGEAERERLEDVVNQARVLVGDAVRLTEARLRIQAEQQATVLRGLSHRLATVFDLAALMDVLATHLPLVGISACYLALYESPQPYSFPQAAPEWSRLFLAYAGNVRAPLEAGGRRFPTRQLVPEGLLPFAQRDALVIAPLHFQLEQLGFVLLHAGPRDGLLYQTLSHEISSAIQKTLLVQRVQERSAELARQQYILDTFMENIPDYVYFKDLESRFTRVNKAQALKFGLTDPAEQIGKSDFDFFPAEAARERYEQEQAIIRTGQPLLDQEEDNSNGEWVLTTKMPLRDEKGHVSGTFGISRNITQLKQAQMALEKAYADVEQRVEKRTAELQREIAERRRTEEALRKSEARYRALVESQTDLIRRYLPDATLTFANDAYCEFFGKTREELLGHSYLFTIPPEQRARVRQENAELATQRSALADEYLNYRWDGEERWIQWISRCITDDSDQVVELQAVGRDITQLKQSEAEREALIAELEARNAELERFLYTVSHDLKSPLITMGGFLGFLEKDALAGNIERIQADTAYIKEALARMRQLLDELLELSRVGRISGPPEVVAFESVAREAVALERQAIAASGVTVVILPHLPTVSGDRARLVEVVQNLVNNACKFMGAQPHPHIEIGAQQEEGRTVFYVRDNGIGIAPQYHEKVFGLFDKLDPQSEGSGVGLALVKRIVETHGGKIWIESPGKGGGTTFCFTLPE